MLVKGKYLNSLVQFVKSMWDLLNNRNTKLFTKCRDIMISDASEWLWILFKSQICSTPFFKQFRESVCRLSSNNQDLPSIVAKICWQIELIKYFANILWFLDRNLFNSYMYYNIMYSPPFIDTNISTSSEPWIQNKYATEGGSSSETFPQRRIIVKSETFAKPMDRVFSTFIIQSLFRIYFATTTTRHFSPFVLYPLNIVFLFFWFFPLFSSI